MSERASERTSAAERASEASSAEQANGRAVRANEQSGGVSGPVLTSLFLAVLNHRVAGVRNYHRLDWSGRRDQTKLTDG